MPFSRDEKQRRADQFRQQVEEQLDDNPDGEVNNNDNEQPCCVPFGCAEGEAVHIDDPDDCQKVVCNNPDCTEGKFMHKTCFDTWEDEVLTYLRSSGRARSWSEKQRRQNLWTKKGYDLAWKACSCKCSKGHLRKDLEWIPPKLPEGAAAENAQQRRHRRRKKSNEKPSIGRANSISSGSNNGNGNGNGHGNGHSGRLRHASASSTCSTESNHTPPQSPSVLSYQSSNPTQQPRFPVHSTPVASSTSTVHTVSSTSTPASSSTSQSHPSNANATHTHSHTPHNVDNWKRQYTNGNKNLNHPHHFTPPVPPPQQQQQQHDFYHPPTNIHNLHSKQHPPNKTSQYQHGNPDFGGRHGNKGNNHGIQAYNANFFGDAYWNGGNDSMAQGGFTGSGTRGFLPRMDLSAFYQVLPAHKLNSYHIKMEEDSQPESEEIRSFIFATLNAHSTRVIPCSVCSRKLPVFDRYPLIDGTFYLTPQRQGDGSIGLQVGGPGRGSASQFLNAVCMQCLEGVQRIVCRICKSRWDGSHHQLGTLYSYDIFAASPCCPGRAGCKRCGKPVLDPTRGTHFFSEYSRSIQCPHCGVPDFHFVKPLSSYEVHSSSIQQINVC